MIKQQLLIIQGLIFILLSVLGGGTATAAITALSGSNIPAQLSGTSTGFSQVSWAITENTDLNTSVVTLSSTSGVFVAPDNTVLGTTRR